MRPCAHKN